LRTLLVLMIALLFAGASQYAVRVVVRESVTTTKSKLCLEDLAEVDPSGSAEEDVALALQRIVISESPAPGAEKTIEGAHILERLKAAGVDLAQVGYSIPKFVIVRRAGRLLEREEIQQALVKSLTSPTSELKSMDYRDNYYVPIGDLRLTATIEDSRRARIIIRTPDWEDTLYIPINLQEWREVPVASRQLRRGEIISSQDVAMARLEVSRIGLDYASSMDGVIGKEIQQDLQFGEVFRKGKIKAPPMISAGEKVLLRYLSGTLEASASGVAVDSAGEGELIKVRNESSKRIIVGQVDGPGLVTVRSR
jgi:flagella basal body P-ring formation protein FlgA